MNIFRFKKLKNWKVVLIVLLGVLIFGIGQVKIAHAWSLFSIADITANAISAVAQAIGYIFGFIGGVFMTIAGYLVTLALNINFALLKSPVVQTGWQIVLNFTNLGFVLAIIVMAFATIFRVQSYAMKKTLWKLIVAALLVNFSLVIAGAFINISDIFSNFFLKQGGIKDPLEWSKAFAAMFRAQALLKVGETIAAQGFVDTATGAINTFGAAGLQTIASVFFIALFTVLACLTLLATAVMLLIRYVFLGILLLLSPIVWLLWIFPGTQHLWQKWWSQFLRWTFFAPIMLFFISLSLYAMKNQPEAVRQFTQNSAAVANVQLTFGVEVIGEMIIVIGLVMGGLFAANSLGITFASTAYGWARSIGKGFGGWVGRKTLEGTGRRILSSERVKGWTEKLSASKVPGARFIGQGINRLGARVEEVTKKPYEELAKRLATNPERLNSEILASRGAKRAVLLSQAAKTKDIGREVQERFINDPEIYTDIEKEFKLSGLDFGALQKTVGRSPKMAQAKTNEELKKATDEFVQSLTPKDYAKGQWNDVFKKTEDEQSKRIQESLATAFAQYEHGAYAKTIPHIKGENLRRFEEIMEDGIETAKKQAKEIKDFEESARVFKYASEAADRLGKTLNRRAMFGGEEAWVPPSPPS